MTDFLRSPLLRPVTVRTKDGREAVIRPVSHGDAAAMLDLERAMLKAGEGVVRLPEEGRETVEEMEEAVARYELTTESAPMKCQYVVELEGVIVGDAFIKRPRYARMRHAASVAIGIRPEAQGIGIGRALMEHLLSWATEGPGTSFGGVSRVELNVFADNERAISLYHSLGFREEGRRERFLRRDDGTFVADLAMALLLPRE